MGRLPRQSPVRILLAGLPFLFGFLCFGGCLVSGQCQLDEDCAGEEICKAGQCTLECREHADCSADELCEANRCVPAEGCQGCPYPDAFHGSAECVHGECRLTGCDENWFDADKNPRTGCECTPTNGGEEICDESDNDCDGLTDEGCTCTPTNGGVEICDGKDNDCDHLVDEDLDCLDCPEDMAKVNERFCIDIYEASRKNATADGPGSGDDGPARSVAGVIPWTGVDQAMARNACEKVGKRLCNPSEWVGSCQGPGAYVYSYGDIYDADICNGIDAFCYCGSDSSCANEPVCPFPHCQKQCGASFHVMPTGSFPRCTNAFGVFDINGNVWEIDSAPDANFRGGAYNCSNSEILHRCDYAAKDPAAKGFRCCK